MADRYPTVTNERWLPTVGRKQAAGGGPHVGGQSEDDGDGCRPEGNVEQ